MQDLFETPEKLPIEVQKVLNNYGEITTYKQCAELVAELKKVGYICNYGLDFCPYELIKL